MTKLQKVGSIEKVVKLEVKGPPIIDNKNKIQNYQLNTNAEIQCVYSTTSKIASMVSIR